MSNIMRRGNGGQQMTTQGEWNPLRAMRDLFRWDPFQEMLPVAPAGWGAATYAPDFEVKETKEGFQFKADLPGIKEKDLDVTCTGNRLSVSGKREAEQEEKSDTYFVYERSYGSFTRSFTLPEGIDAEHIKAELKDGVLSVMVPKKAEQMPKKITVQATDKPKS